MNLERNHQILDELRNDPCQSADSIISKVSRNKSLYPAERGDMSETMIKFLVEKVAKVEKVTPVHIFIYKIDCDLKVEFAHAEPIYIQVKTTEKAARGFKHKLATFKQKTGKSLRIVTLSSETSFNEIIEDFVNQVNSLENRRFLFPVKFCSDKPRKRKSY